MARSLHATTMPNPCLERESDPRSSQQSVAMLTQCTQESEASHAPNPTIKNPYRNSNVTKRAKIDEFASIDDSTLMAAVSEMERRRFEVQTKVTPQISGLEVEVRHMLIANPFKKMRTQVHTVPTMVTDHPGISLLNRYAKGFGSPPGSQYQIAKVSQSSKDSECSLPSKRPIKNPQTNSNSLTQPCSAQTTARSLSATNSLPQKVASSRDDNHIIESAEKHVIRAVPKTTSCDDKQNPTPTKTATSTAFESPSTGTTPPSSSPAVPENDNACTQIRSAPRKAAVEAKKKLAMCNTWVAVSAAEMDAAFVISQQDEDEDDRRDAIDDRAWLKAELGPWQRHQKRVSSSTISQLSRMAAKTIAPPPAAKVTPAKEQHKKHNGKLEHPASSKDDFADSSHAGILAPPEKVELQVAIKPASISCCSPNSPKSPPPLPSSSPPPTEEIVKPLPLAVITQTRKIEDPTVVDRTLVTTPTQTTPISAVDKTLVSTTATTAPATTNSRRVLPLRKAKTAARGSIEDGPGSRVFDFCSDPTPRLLFAAVRGELTDPIVSQDSIPGEPEAIDDQQQQLVQQLVSMSTNLEKVLRRYLSHRYYVQMKPTDDLMACIHRLDKLHGKLPPGLLHGMQNIRWLGYLASQQVHLKLPDKSKIDEMIQHFREMREEHLPFLYSY